MEGDDVPQSGFLWFKLANNFNDKTIVLLTQNFMKVDLFFPSWPFALEADLKSLS